MEITLDAVIAIVAAAVGGVAIWLFNIHGRLSAHEQGCAVRQGNLEKSLDRIDKKLDRHDQKLDRLMGAGT